ncbi:MAG: manganese efflux pump [Bacteroidaceae bacterium]|nr:manganese efflux pump [Bacteroidaceae bacterium]MBQ8807629.1 manganese efflux pump [Bacteroidaceae bacterium]
MTILDLFLLATGDAMDACAVSMAKGTATRKPTYRHYMSVGLWFGGFQTLMTLLGYFVGSRFTHLVESWDHWISFILLALLGLGLIKEAISKDEQKADKSYSAKTMFVMAVATSIDALAVGVSLAFTDANIWIAGAIIGVVTFLFSVAGLKVGHLFGNRYKSTAEIIGGVVLIFIGAKILLSHLL